MTTPSFDILRLDYEALWRSMKIDPANRGLFDSVARRLYKSIDRYKAIEKLSGVPAIFIMVAHERESGGDFNTYLGNGEPLNRETRLVPKGRGPFKTFEEGALDALRIQGYAKPRKWTLERLLFELEAYNGFGYRLYHRINTPYLWARTSHYDRGKYVADGKFDATVRDPQTGCAGIISALWALDPALRLPFEDAREPGTPVKPEAPEIPMVPADPIPIKPRIPDAPPTPPFGGFFLRISRFLRTGEWQ